MRPVTLQDYKQRMLRVLVHIQQHLDGPLPLDTLASVACFSPYHFHRIFRGMVGESVKEHVRRLRLERAASALKLGAAPVTQIAFDAGYESLEAFSRSFTAAFGMAPSRYRAAKGVRTRRSSARVPYRHGEALQHFRTVHRGGFMNVEIKRLSPMRVAFVRHQGPYSDVSSAWEKLMPVLGQEGYLGADSMCIGICHDDPEVTSQHKIRYDACVTVDDDFTPRGDIGIQTIAGGDYAMATHMGPYDKLGETYAALLGDWVPRSGRELRHSPCFEVYLNDPNSTDPEDLLVDVYAPLEPIVTRRGPRS